MELFLLLAVLVIAFLVRLPFFKCHINPDVGPMAYYAYFKDKGVRLGRDYPVILGYKAGLYYLFGFSFGLFGKDVRKERLFFALYNLLSVVFLYLLAWDFFGHEIAILSALFYAFFSSIPALEGYKTSAENYAVLPIILIYYLSYTLLQTDKLWPSLVLGGMVGFCSSLVIIYLKLTLIFSIAGAMVWLAWMHRFVADFVGIGLGVVLCILFVFIVAQRGGYWQSDLISQSLKQLFAHGATYQKKFLDIICRFVGSFTPILWQAFPLFISGVFGLTLAISNFNPESSLLVIWLVVAILDLLIQRAFYPQMFIQFVPTVSIFASFYLLSQGYTFTDWPFIMTLLLFACPLIYLYKFYFISGHSKIDDTKWGERYLAVEQLGGFLKENTDIDDYVLQWGEFVQLNVFADRLAPYTSTFMYVDPGNDHKFTQSWRPELIAALKAKMPKFIAVTNDDPPDLDFIYTITGLRYTLDWRGPTPQFPVLRLLDNHPENQKESEKNCIDNGKCLFFSENRRAVDAAINLITRNFYSFFGEIEGHDAVVLDFDI